LLQSITRITLTVATNLTLR